MRLVTFLDNSARQHIGALTKDGRIADLNAAHALHQRESTHNASRFSCWPADMRALFEGGDRSLDAARAALEFVEKQQAGQQARPASRCSIGAKTFG